MTNKGIILMFVLAAMLAATAGADVITPEAVVASSQYSSASGPGHLIDPSHLSDSTQHIAKKWGSNWFASNKLDTSANWVYVDLGDSYSLDEIRIWNYHEICPSEVNGRGTKGCSVWVGSKNADLPKADQNSNIFISGKGWNKVWAGDLKQGPSTKGPISDIGPTNVFEVSGQAKVRYVGIDIASRWGKDPHTTKPPGLSYIQVTGKIEIANAPVPRNSGKGVDLSATLSWTKPGLYSPSGYEVYLSTDKQKVASGDTSVKVSASDSDGNSKNTQYVPDADLLERTQYYWRVDSIVDGKAIRGKVWSFKTMLKLDDLGFDEIIFVKRKPYSADHFYSMMDNGTSADRFMAENGIYIYNLSTEQVRAVVTAADMPGGTGLIGKLDLSFDAKKVVFDFRQTPSAPFRIWEVNVDGSGLRQLTFDAPDEPGKLTRWQYCDDMHPCYSPDGGIIFTSSRNESMILCFGDRIVTTVVLHRMDADGSNIEQLSNSLISEFNPVAIGDGRIMYSRWEYVDKGARVGKTIWAMNPDGTKSEELYGLSDQYVAEGAFMYAQPVVGNSSMIVCSETPHCCPGGGNALGPIKLIDLSKDTRTTLPVTNITPDVVAGVNAWYFASDNFKSKRPTGVGGPLYTHPYSINESQFLVTHKYNHNDHYMSTGGFAIFMIDLDGNHAMIYEDEDETVSCWHPIPLKARPNPAKIHSFRQPQLKAENKALCILPNVYHGLDSVAPGTIKYLRINNAIPRSWDSYRRWSPTYTSDRWIGALWPRAQIGIVPVEEDGSAHFTVPADTNVFFQALDENYMEVQRERTYVNYRPGEVRSCNGCHEQSNKAPRPIAANTPDALKRPPSTPLPQPCDLVVNGGDGRPEQLIHYPSDVQPIFDAKCISCHGNTTPDGDLNLTGTVDYRYSTSYNQLVSKNLSGLLFAEFINFFGGDGGNINGSYLPPMNLGAHKSGLISKVRTTDSQDPHYQLLNEFDMQRLIRWADSNYQFYGSYYGRHHGNHSDDPDFRRKATYEEAINPSAPSWHN